MVTGLSFTLTRPLVQGDRGAVQAVPAEWLNLALPSATC